MTRYRPIFSDHALNVLRHLHPELKGKIRAGIEELLDRSEEGKALHRELTGLRSHRVGRHRIIYKVQGGELHLIAVGPRSVIYEETARLLNKRP